jgi:putative transcriptional regulator
LPLRLVRLASGYSQDELAARAGLARTTISLLESGRTPTLESARRLSRALGTPLDVLFPAGADPENAES